MNDLKDYFEPISNEVKRFKSAEGTIGSHIEAVTIDWRNPVGQIALIGVLETRNSISGTFKSQPDSIRSYLYKLANVARVQLIDLGNIKQGKSVKDSYASIQHVVEVLQSYSIIPLIIGGSHDLTVPIFKAIIGTQDEAELTLIDSRLDGDDQENHSQSFVAGLEKEFANRIIFSLLAYQNYFIPGHVYKKSLDNHWNLFRLGAMRNNFIQVEPILRDSQLVSFDLSSVRQAESPGTNFQSPNGLYAEEACQLASLSGMSDLLKGFYISEYNAANDINGQTAHLVAQMIWYFIHGYSNRKADYPVKNLDSYKKIFVKVEKIDSDLIFYQNQQNKRFWVEIPQSSNQNKVISCSLEDYQKACNNEVPDRIWQNISRYMK